MTPKKFKESNQILTKPGNMTDEECGSLHVFTDGNICVSCWKLTWKERLKALFTGKVWLLVWSGITQPPVSLVSDNPIVPEKEPQK